MTDAATRHAVGWPCLICVVAVATFFLGPLALGAALLVAGGVLIRSGARASGWRRPVLIVAGAAIVAFPVVFVVDFLTATGGLTVS